MPGGETRPYKAKVSLSKEKNDWAYYIRKQSSTIRAKGEDERELIGLAATVPFDDRYNQSASMDDLSLRLIEEFLKEVGSDLAEKAPTLEMDNLARQMNIAGGPPEALFPKNVGLLFFNEEPHRFFPVRFLIKERAAVQPAGRVEHQAQGFGEEFRSVDCRIMIEETMNRLPLPI